MVVAVPHKPRAAPRTGRFGRLPGAGPGRGTASGAGWRLAAAPRDMTRDPPRPDTPQPGMPRDTSPAMPLGHAPSYAPGYALGRMPMAA